MNWFGRKQNQRADEREQEVLRLTSVTTCLTCPMCDSSLPADPPEPLSTCPDCGADLILSKRKGQLPAAKPSQPKPSQPDLPEQETTRPARNGLYCLAATWAIPAILLTVATAILSPPEDAVILTLTLCAIPIVLCVMSVIAALLFSAGRKSGRLWAFLPVWILMFCFPVGTIVAYKVHLRLDGANLS